MTPNAVRLALARDLGEKERRADNALRAVEEEYMAVCDCDPRSEKLDKEADRLAGYLTDIDECLRLLGER